VAFCRGEDRHGLTIAKSIDQQLDHFPQMNGLLIMAASSESGDRLKQFDCLVSRPDGFGLNGGIEQHLER
jgi:hypothetical protein